MTPKLTFCALLALGMLTVVAPPAGSQEKTGAALEVNVNYTGSGTVDEKHKIFVVLWDSPEFIQGNAMPVEVLPLTARRATVVFPRVAKSPAYISAAYDPTGQWDAQSGPPPAGSSLGLYSKTEGKPEPITVDAGKKTSIELNFNDAVKMP